jgi:hypothetical protein
MISVYKSKRKLESRLWVLTLSRFLKGPTRFYSNDGSVAHTFPFRAYLRRSESLYGHSRRRNPRPKLINILHNHIQVITGYWWLGHAVWWFNGGIGFQFRVRSLRRQTRVTEIRDSQISTMPPWWSNFCTTQRYRLDWTIFPTLETEQCLAIKVEHRCLPFLLQN